MTHALAGQKLKGASDQQQFNRNVEDFEVWMAEIEGSLMSEDYGKVTSLKLFLLLSPAGLLRACILNPLAMSLIFILVAGKTALIISGIMITDGKNGLSVTLWPPSSSTVHSFSFLFVLKFYFVDWAGYG